MKILEYSLGLPPYRRGGLVQYSIDLSEELVNQGHDVIFVYPGKIKKLNSEDIAFKKEKTEFPFSVYEMINPLPVSLGLGISESNLFYQPKNKDIIEQFLIDIHPDVIHLHTIMGMPQEFLSMAKKLKIRLVFTTHDFYGLCSKMLPGNDLKSLQETECSYDCMLCADGPSPFKLKLMQTHFYKHFKNNFLIKQIRKFQKRKLNGENKLTRDSVSDRIHLRNYYRELFNTIDFFHFNSNLSMKEYKKYLPDIHGKVIPITEKSLDSITPIIKNQKSYISFGYIGPYDEKKGFYLLKKLLYMLRKEYTDFDIHFYGDIKNDNLFSEYWAENHGILRHNEIRKAYEKIDILIVPSLWHETFGLIVLEALKYGVPCLVSSNVGAGDLIDNSDSIFDNEIELYKKMKDILNGNSIKYQTCNNITETFSEHCNLMVKEIIDNRG